MEKLLSYNETPANNPLRLLPAYQLYKNAIYRALVARFGVENTYILSAGRGAHQRRLSDARLRCHVQQFGG